MRYKALARDATIGPEEALIQGALALDAAAEKAELTNDIEGLLNVAAMWMKLSEQIQGFVEAAEEQEKAEEVLKASEAKIEVGFQRSKEDPEHITAEEDEELND